MAITVRSVGVSPGADSTSCVIVKPVGLTVGDLMFAQVIGAEQSGDIDTFTAPVDWTTIRQDDYISTTKHFHGSALFWKIADSGDVSASNFTFVATGADSNGGAITAFTAGTFDSTTPINANNGQYNTSYSNTITAPTITPSVADCMILLACHCGSNLAFSGYAIATSNPASWSEAYDIPLNLVGDIGLAMGYAIRAETTATGNGTATPSGTCSSAGQLVAIAPAVSGTTVTPTTASLTITGYAPTISVSDNKLMTPTTASLTITGYAPTITADGSIIVTPTTASLSITGYPPTVTASSDKVITPITASLIITGYPPTVTGDPIPVAPESALKYTIEIRNNSAELINYLEKAFGISYSRRVNEPPELSFQMPADDDKLDDAILPNEFWLRKEDTLVEKFLITNDDYIHDDNLITSIEGKGFLSQLAGAVVTTYAPDSDTGTIATALLAYQSQTPKLTAGTIQPTDDAVMSWSNTTALKCLNDLIEVSGGYVYTSSADSVATRTLSWMNSIGEDKGQQIRYRKNMTGIKRTIDWEGLYTRLYATGSSVKLSDKLVTLETGTKSEDATYGYLSTDQGDYICYKGWTGAGDALDGDMAVRRKGAATDYTADIAGNLDGSDWADYANVLDIDWSDYATWTDATGISNMLGIRWTAANKTISGCSIRLQLTSTATLNRIRIYKTLDTFGTTTLIHTATPGYTLSDGALEFDADFGETHEVEGLTFDFSISGTGTTYVYSFWGWNEYYDESASWKQGDDEQIIRIPIASYHSGDIYYLTYYYADYIKDFTATSTYVDRGVPMSFNYATDIDTLITWAKAALPTLTYPVSYQVNALLLDEVSANFSFEELQLGSTVTVIDEDKDISVSVRVVGITQPSLDTEPARATIEITNKIKSLPEAFRALWNRI